MTYRSYSEFVRDVFPDKADHYLAHRCMECAERCEEEHPRCPKKSVLEQKDSNANKHL